MGGGGGVLEIEGDENVCKWLTTTIYKNFPGNTDRKVNGTRLFGSSQRKISGSNRTPEKVVLFFRMKYYKQRNSCSISSRPSLIPVSGLRGRFSVNGIDLCKWYLVPGSQDSGEKSFSQDSQKV